MNTDYMQVDSPKVGAECAADGQTAGAVLQERLLELVRSLDTLGTADALKRAEILVQLGHTQLELEQKEEAWDSGKEAFRIYVRHEDWEGAVTACDVMFFADRPDSLAALGHGLWLAVTYPVNPELRNGNFITPESTGKPDRSLKTCQV